MTYNDVRDWLRREKAGKEQAQIKEDWDEVVFEIDLLKSQEINLDYILELIENQKQSRISGRGSPLDTGKPGESR